MLVCFQKSIIAINLVFSICKIKCSFDMVLQIDIFINIIWIYMIEVCYLHTCVRHLVFGAAPIYQKMSIVPRS